MASARGDELLIELVKMYPVIYDVSSPRYKDNASKENAWQEISMRMGLNGAECEKRWRILRDSYTRQIREDKKQKPGDATWKRKKVCRYFEQMGFLAKYVKSRKIFGSDVNSQLDVPEHRTLLLQLSDGGQESNSYEERFDDNTFGTECNTYEDDAYAEKDVDDRPKSTEIAQSLSRSPSPLAGTSHNVGLGNASKYAEFLKDIRGTADAIIASLAKPEEDEVNPFCKYLSEKMKTLSPIECARLEFSVHKTLLEFEEARDLDK